ncbi:MAG: hypothetical protein GEU78_08920 [Actinobacteria bacterium]|nr:hypothetical protein [Actinomycetota bacterium]
MQEVHGNHRLVLACSALDVTGAALGVVFTVLIEGRAPHVTVAPPETPIPEAWHPVRVSGNDG